MAFSNEIRKKPIARALYQFVGQSAQELSFSPGEAILLLKRVDDNWLEGELDGQIGIFPKNRVKVEVGSPSLSSESALARSGRPCAVVLNDFTGNCEGDLPLVQGQIVELLGSVSSGWTRGKVGDTVGIFPSSFVEILQPLVSKPVPKPRGHKPVPKPRRSTTTLNNAHSINDTVHSIKGTAHSIDDTTHSSNNTTHSTDDIPHSVDDTTHSTDDTAHSTNDTAHSTNDTAHSTTTSFTSVSSFERHLSSLHTTLDVEEKMRHSAESLSKVCGNEEKKEKLIKTMMGHESKIRKISKEIELLESQRDTIITQCTPVVPPVPKMGTVPPNNDNTQSIKVTQELIETEQSYHQELSSFCTKVLPSFKQWNEVTFIELFANIEEVTVISGKLCAALLEDSKMGVAQEGDVTQEVGVAQGVGVVFKSLANELKEVYGTYCRNHDHASQLLEKLYEDKDNVTTIKSLMELGRPEVTSWDLHTLLIKPVQRVLKYPLLLSKLLEVTSKDEPHYKSLSVAVKLSSQVAQDINEIKRRKDLLERYTGAGRDDRRINLGTMRKKMRRFRQTLTQKTGLRSATMDSHYSNEESQLLSLESLLRTFQTNISNWIEEGEQLLSSHDTLLNTMCDYVNNSSIVSSHKERSHVMKEKWNLHVSSVKDEVLVPLGILISLFNDPILLMNKRSDKLLDYDSLQYDLEKCTETDKIPQLKDDVTLAKRTYEALNTQLLEDLPQLREKVTQGLCILLSRYLRLQVSYHKGCTTSSLETSDMIIQSHLTALRETFNHYCTLSIVPSSLPLSFGIVLHTNTLISSHSFEEPPLSTRPLLIKRTGRSQSMVTTPISRSYIPPQSPIYEEIPDNIKQDILSPPQHNDEATPPIHGYDTPPNDDDSDHEYLIPPDALTPTLSLSPLSMDTPIKAHSPPLEGTQLVTVYDFTGESDIELSLQAGQVVSLITPHDQEGSDEWWLVRDNATLNTGYVPSVFFNAIN